VVEAWGAVRLPARGGHGLVSRRVEIRGLVARVESLERELADARAHGDALEETIQVRVVDQRRRQEAAQRLELEVEHAARLLGENEAERSRLAERRAVVEAELTELVAQEGELERELAEKRGLLVGIAAERAGLEEVLAALEAERGPIEALLAEVEGETSRLRVETTQTEERLVAQRREQMRVQSELEERRDRRRRLEEDSERERARLEKLAAVEGRDRERLAGLEGSLAGLSGRVAEAEAGSAAAKERLREAERILARLRREESALRERREQSLLADNERRVRIEGIREKLASELGVESAAALPIDAWRAELAAELGEEALLARLRGEQEQIADRLKKNANVNLQAVEELGGEEGRRDHIATQLADLEQSRATLLETIETLNVRSRDLFLSTFETVRRHFQEIFATVFNGGTADLLLEEGVDPLEAGVEVQARPPGKKITSLRALSGGEKALTAVSVLFALFRTKPSPFCILDEVDAPLDESNTRRFVRVLSRFADQSQFLIITHSRVTMGEAERLYGVTMEEEGVSKRVAVRVEREAGEEAMRDPTVSADALLPPPMIARSDEAQEAPALTS
jgi:chromosome segregation protein